MSSTIKFIVAGKMMHGLLHSEMIVQVIDLLSGVTVCLGAMVLAQLVEDGDLTSLEIMDHKEDASAEQMVQLTSAHLAPGQKQVDLAL